MMPPGFRFWAAPTYFAIGDRVESFIPYWAGFSNFYVNDVTLK